MNVNYILKDEDIVSIQLLIILNFSNLFIMFFMFFIFFERTQNINNRVVTRRILPTNHIRTFNINFEDICQDVFSDDFPYDDICSICLDEFTIDNNINVVKTINCSHYFHKDCIDRWLHIRQTCPNCNINLVARFIEQD